MLKIIAYVTLFLSSAVSGYNHRLSTIAYRSGTLALLSSKLKTTGPTALQGGNFGLDIKTGGLTSLLFKEDTSPVCSPWDSCKGRCGHPLGGTLFSCHCDIECLDYGDCCIDFEEICQISEKREDFREGLLPQKCISLPNPPYPIYVVRGCKKDIKSEDYQKCKGPWKPVSSLIGTVFSNIFCAKCNDIHDVVEWSWNSKKNQYAPPDSVPIPRACIPSIATCPKGFVEEEKWEKENYLCQNIAGPVIPSIYVGWNHILQPTKTIFKNKNCAKCHGFKKEKLQCPSWSMIIGPDELKQLLGIPLNYHRNGENELLSINRGLPYSFSILLNVGLDGKEKLLLTSEREQELKENQEKCPHHHIWDPFSKLCRRLYCSPEYLLIDFKCVKNPNVELPEAEPKLPSFVHLIMNFQIEYKDYVVLRHMNLTKSLTRGLVEEFGICPERITDLTVNIQSETLNYNKSVDGSRNYDTESNGNKISPIVLRVEFLLHDPQ